MHLYLLYIMVAAVTVAIPGPAVILTLSNTFKYGFNRSLFGIMGIATGILLIAMISATSLGVILTTSALTFTLIKYIGALYLIYLGIKLWRTQPARRIQKLTGNKTNPELFFEGLTVSLLNPKAILFFMTLFPQFLVKDQSYTHQLILLTVTFSCLVIVIHSLYSLATNSATKKMVSPRISHAINRLSGSVLMLFGIGLAASNR